MIEFRITGTTPEEICAQMLALAQSLNGQAEATPAPVKTAKPEPVKAEEKPAKKAPAKTAAKSEASEELPEVDEKKLRMFCAKAMKKDVDSAAIIKRVSGGIAKISDIDPALYPKIYAEVQEAMEQLNG